MPRTALHLASTLAAPPAGLAAAAAAAAVLPSGHAALDAALPGGGWPLDGVVELLQPGRAERHVWQLMLPALAQALRRHGGPVVLVGAPLEPFGPALAAQGLPPARLLCVRAPDAAARLWATEQALRCADVAAVLAWLPQEQGAAATAAALRRLQLAVQRHGRLLALVRGQAARQQASPARLRLLLQEAPPDAAASPRTPPRLAVHILKRPGPPLLQPVLLPALPAPLLALLAARRRKAAGAVPGLAAGAVPARPRLVAVRGPENTGSADALDRAAARP